MTVQNLTITTSTNRRNIRLVIFRVLDTLCGISYSIYLNYIHLINPRFQERRMIEKYFLYILPGSSTKQPESTIKFKQKILFSTLLIKGFRNQQELQSKLHQRIRKQIRYIFFILCKRLFLVKIEMNNNFLIRFGLVYFRKGFYKVESCIDLGSWEGFLL